MNCLQCRPYIQNTLISGIGASRRHFSRPRAPSGCALLAILAGLPISSPGRSAAQLCGTSEHFSRKRVLPVEVKISCRRDTSANLLACLRVRQAQCRPIRRRLMIDIRAATSQTISRQLSRPLTTDRLWLATNSRYAGVDEYLLAAVLLAASPFIRNCTISFTKLENTTLAIPTVSRPLFQPTAVAIGKLPWDGLLQAD